MSSRRLFRAATVSARLVVGAAVSAGAVLLVVGAIAAPWPQIAPAPASVAAAPAATETVLSCAGPLLATGRDVSRSRDLTVAAELATVAGSVPGGVDVDRSSLKHPGVADGGAAALRAQPVDRVAAVFAGASSSTVAADDLRGFAAAACQPALMESWIVAGATTTGHSDLVVLANPGAVGATADLTVYGAQGAQTVPGGSGIVVPAGSERVVALAGLLPGEENPVVRITAGGAPLRATLQSAETRTLTPIGVDQVGAIPAASPVQVIPGVRLPGPVEGELTGSVRLLSDAPSTVTVTVTDAVGAEALRQQVALGPDVPGSIELGGLPAGVYTVTAQAASPLVAAAWAASADATDFAWWVSAPGISGSAQFAVAAGPAPELTIVNPEAQPATVTLQTRSGKETRLTVPARGSIATTVTAGAVYGFESDRPVHAAVGYSGDASLASYPVWPDSAVAPTVTVYP